MENTRLILETKGIGKEFNGVWVLRDIDFDLAAGEVHTLVGENGAGKSTFIKLLSGVHIPSAGSIALEGRPAPLSGVEDSEKAGVRTVHQEINLVPFFGAYQNIFIGAEKKRRFAGIPFMNDRLMKAEARKALNQLGVDIPITVPAYQLDASLQRILQIAKVLVHSPKVLILDEPTTSLSEEERETVLRIIKGLKQKGMGIIFITHNIEEVMELSDRITVFRDGANVGTLPRAEATPAGIVSMMIGHKSLSLYTRESSSTRGEVELELDGVSTHALHGVSLRVQRGEILGVAGVVGAGKTEIARAIFGLDRIRQGSIRLGGKKHDPSPQSSVAAGIALVPEERQEQGLIPTFSVMKNVTLTYLTRYTRGGLIDTRGETRVTEKYIDLLSIKTSGPGQSIRFLSGGNQQKVVLSRWLNGDFRVGLFDEPTKGIDVNAKEDVYRLVDKLARDGKSIIFFSSYLPELMTICDRILVMHAGKMVGEFDPHATDAKGSIMHAMLGGKGSQ